jgi:hypothetical protein
VIGGDLAYTSQQAPQIASGATVRGQTEGQIADGRQPEATPLSVALNMLFGWLRALIPLLVLGFLLVLFFPAFSRGIVAALRDSPWVSLGLGVLLLIGVPILAVAVFAGGLFIGGWWLAPIMLAAYLVALALSVVAAGLAVGHLILRVRPGVHLGWTMLLGLAILTLVGLVPFVGPLVIFLAALFGLGALTLAAVRGRHEPALPAWSPVAAPERPLPPPPAPPAEREPVGARRRDR